jgi:ABC-2 type transport system ATP-binding protein
VGFVFQAFNLVPSLSARENVAIPLLLAGVHRRPAMQRAEELLERVGLADRAGDPVRTYSHGMNQRLGLALILLGEPELVILDEPTTGLDPQGMKEVRDLIVQLSRERGVTILLSSHLLYEVELIATRMAIIHQGRLRVAGSVRDLLEAGPAEVLVKTDRAEELLRFLRASEPTRPASLRGDGVLVELAAARIPELNRQLVGAGFAVYGLVPRRSLETYFLQLIEGREA